MKQKIKPIPPMTDFEFDDVMRVLLGVKPKSVPKPQKQKSSKKSQKLD